MRRRVLGRVGALAVAALAQRVGGRVRAESAEGRGSTFAVVLPAAERPAVAPRPLPAPPSSA